MILSCPPPPEKKKKMTGIHTLNFLSVPFDRKVQRIQLFLASLKKNSEPPTHKPAASLAGGVEVWTKNGMSPFTGLRQSLIFLCIVTARET